MRVKRLTRASAKPRGGILRRDRSEHVRVEGVSIDSLVEGTYGSWPEDGKKHRGRGRVTRITPWGWIVAWDAVLGRQLVFYPERYQVVGDPRPEKAWDVLPEHLSRG